MNDYEPQVQKVFKNFALLLREFSPIFLAGCSPPIRGNLNKILVQFKHQLCLFQSCPRLHLPLTELHDVGDHGSGLVDAVGEEPEGRHAQLAHKLLEVV